VTFHLFFCASFSSYLLILVWLTRHLWTRF
jgi:hypothetical protein